MKYFRKYLKITSLVAAITMLASSCELTDLDINEDPNNPTQAAPNLLLTASQTGVVRSLEGVNYNVHGFVGLMNSADDFNLNNNSYNFLWNTFYSGSMKDIDELIRATESTNNPHYLGIAQTMKAYFTGMFVDMFGDVPYSEAWQGNAAVVNKAPAFDEDKNIYDDLIMLCDAAIENLGKTSPVAVSGDLYYGNNAGRWRNFARAVKLKLLFNARKTRPGSAAELTASFAEVEANALTDFTYRYNSLASPEGRHPWFQSAYLGDNIFPHISHQFMIELIADQDPRLPFYLKRQNTKILNPLDPGERGTIPAYRYLVAHAPTTQRLYGKDPEQLTSEEKDYLAGFFGRDRGDRTGLPLDGALRTAPGVYPAGGLYDSSPRVLDGKQGGSGAGIFPLLTNNMIKFWKIEAILDNGVPGNAEALFEAAIRESIANVVTFGKQRDANAVEPAAAAIDAYVALWMQRYQDAPSNAAKLNVVLKQAWFANWGNGFETWNAMRRTGLPSTVDAPRQKVRQFPLRLPYPSQEISNNANAGGAGEVTFDQTPVFWDVVKLKL